MAGGFQLQLSHRYQLGISPLLPPSPFYVYCSFLACYTKYGYMVIPLTERFFSLYCTTYNIFNIAVFQFLLIFTWLFLKILDSVLAHIRNNFSKHLPLSPTGLSCIYGVPFKNYINKTQLGLQETVSYPTKLEGFKGACWASPSWTAGTVDIYSFHIDP